MRLDFQSLWYCYDINITFRDFVQEKLGTKYVEGRSLEFSKSFEESGPSTPMFFILSPGVNPIKDVEVHGKKIGFSTDKLNFHNISLGQGQEVVAESALDTAMKDGHWVILQVVSAIFFTIHIYLFLIALSPFLYCFFYSTFPSSTCSLVWETKYTLLTLWQIESLNF